MPTLSIFFGIVIYIYWSDHNPPHIHARYSGEEADCSADVMPPLLPSAAPWRVTSCEVIGDHRLHVRFRDGLEGDIQFSETAFHGVFAHLVDPARLAEAEVVLAAVTWPGALDIAPDRIHADIKREGVCVL